MIPPDSSSDLLGGNSLRTEHEQHRIDTEGGDHFARLVAPKFWPGDGGQFIGTGDITFTASPESGRINVGCYREMLHGPARIGMYCSPGKHGLLDREAWWAKTTFAGSNPLSPARQSTLLRGSGG